MVDLASDFKSGRVIKVDLQIPLLAQHALYRFSEITNAQNICIAGGFARGLYMQQVLNLHPKMNDVDIFADIPVEHMTAVKSCLEHEFGSAVRFHVGRFENEATSRGLVEFALPESIRKDCAGAESFQLNCGVCHPWADPFRYVSQANVGMNQIAIGQDGTVMASQAFFEDMHHKQMTMNPERQWTVHDWARTVKSLERMLTERPEFKGWKTILTQKPHTSTAGTFWHKPPCVLKKPAHE